MSVVGAFEPRLKCYPGAVPGNCCQLSAAAAVIMAAKIGRIRFSAGESNPCEKYYSAHLATRIALTNGNCLAFFTTPLSAISPGLSNKNRPTFRFTASLSPVPYVIMVLHLFSSILQSPCKHCLKSRLFFVDNPSQSCIFKIHQAWCWCKTKGQKMKTIENENDVEIHNHGSVVMVLPLTKAAMEWVQGNVSLESWQWLGGGFACEPRMVQNLIDGMENDGLTIAL